MMTINHSTFLPTVCMLAAAGLTGLLGCRSSAAERSVPPFPPPEGKLRILIDADAACEVDDQYAIGLALLSPERFHIEGFVGAHFGDSGGPEGIEKSVAEINTVLAKAGLAGKYPVKRGSHPLPI